MIPIIPVHAKIVPSTALSIPSVPFYSQFKDIHTASWQKVGCGIASLAMIIDYYSTDTISVDTLLKEGINRDAYNIKNGWIHKGLISLSSEYGLSGDSYDLTFLGKNAAFEKLKTSLADGPVIVSIHYKFDPRSSIPHLVVLDGIDDQGIIYYNDPAAQVGKKKISSADFQRGWKKKFIVLRPTENFAV
jgi:ABC-type bacteriocin/lantibiotic exporter with double-glycine peptidase domain